MNRVAFGIAAQVVIATVLTAVIGAGWLVLVGAETDFVKAALERVLLFTDIAIVTWLVLLIVGGVRRRGLGWGIRGSVLAALAGVAMNLVWIGALSLINGGFDPAAVELGVQGGIFFVIAVGITAPLVLGVLVKPSGEAQARA